MSPILVVFQFHYQVISIIASPTLASIVRDYLAIQGSSVASEQAFSSGCLTNYKSCNQMYEAQYLRHYDF